MRIISILFSLYVLLLACYPCNDGNTCADEQRIGATADASDHDHKPGEADLCSPFCICSCCAAHIQLANSPVVYFIHHEHNTKVLTLYIEKPILESTHAIWQPPRIA